MKNQKLISSKNLETLRKAFPTKSIVLGTGCFDILHAGHLCFIKEAKLQGDILVIGINSDQSVKKIKGKNRPINKQNERAELLSAISYVDYVFIFDETIVDEYIVSLQPNVFVIGEESLTDYPSESIVAEKIGSKIHVVRRTPMLSTSRIISSICDNG